MARGRTIQGGKLPANSPSEKGFKPMKSAPQPNIEGKKTGEKGHQSFNSRPLKTPVKPNIIATPKGFTSPTPPPSPPMVTPGPLAGTRVGPEPSRVGKPVRGKITGLPPNMRKGK
jgi:hypothetical protein